MLNIRVVNTKGNSRAVQVVDEEIAALSEIARSFIKDATHQASLFSDMEQQDNVTLLSQC
jgi:hypothetical protein